MILAGNKTEDDPTTTNVWISDLFGSALAIEGFAKL
jgi:hypothetical protein